MSDGKSMMSVLVVSSSHKAPEYFREVLPQQQFSPIDSVESAGEAKRILVDTPYDIIVINTPLKDEFGAQFAIDAAQNSDSGVLIFVKEENYEQVTFKTEEYGVFTLSRPTNRQTVFQAVKVLMAARSKIRTFEEKTVSLESKMREIRLVNRAKLLLIQNLKMSEADAHRYIEKAAMDNCVKKVVIAENIIKMYE